MSVRGRQRQPGRWFVHDNKKLVVRIESFSRSWLFTKDHPNGILEPYWPFIIVDPDMAWDEYPTEAKELIASWKR